MILLETGPHARPYPGSSCKQACAAAGRGTSVLTTESPGQCPLSSGTHPYRGHRPGQARACRRDTASQPGPPVLPQAAAARQRAVAGTQRGPVRRLPPGRKGRRTGGYVRPPGARQPSHHLRRVGVMRVLQLDSHKLFVTACRRHLPLPRRRMDHRSGDAVGIGVRQNARSPDRRQVPGSALRQSLLAYRKVACSLLRCRVAVRPAGSPFGSPTAESEQAFVRRAAPRPRLERGTYSLGGIPVTRPDVAPCGLTCRSAAARIAGRGLEWPDACGRWLPAWLPGISLAEITFE